MVAARRISYVCRTGRQGAWVQVQVKLYTAFMSPRDQFAVRLGGAFVTKSVPGPGQRRRATGARISLRVHRVNTKDVGQKYGRDYISGQFLTTQNRIDLMLLSFNDDSIPTLVSRIRNRK